MPSRYVTPFTVNEPDPMEAVTASGYCEQIVVRQQADENPKIVYIVREPLATSPDQEMFRAESYVFKGPFQGGQVVGHLKAKNVGESGTFTQREDY